MSLIITGASDDLIEIDGDIKEEFPVPPGYDEKGVLLALSDGTVLRIRWTDGIWRITPEARVGTSSDLTITLAVAGDEDNHSDRVTIDGPIAWVVLGTDWAFVRPASTAGRLDGSVRGN